MRLTAFCRRPLAASALLALALAGCNVLPARTELALYSPTLALHADPQWPRLPGVQLAVQRPNADRLASGNRLLVRQGGNELQVLKGASWAQPAPEMLQDALLHLYEESDALAGVARRGNIAADYDLALDLRRFDAEYGDSGAPVTVLAVSARLIDNKRNLVIAQRSFQQRHTAEGRDAAAVAAAFGHALGLAAQDIAGWSLSAAAAAPR